MQFLRDALLPRRAQKCPRLQPEPFLSRPDGLFFHPTPVSDWSGLGCPGELRNPPDCSQSYFPDCTLRISFIPPPVSDWPGLGCPGEQPELFLRERDRFFHSPLFPTGTFGRRLSDFLAFLIYPQNYFETILRIQFLIRNLIGWGIYC